MVGRHGENAKGTGLRALLFETLDADFKLQPLIDLPVLEVAELFVDAVFLSDGCIFQTVIDRRSNERSRQKQA
jgi:hypothetical protein